MKRIFGLILLALAVWCGTNIAKKLSAPDQAPRTGNASYEAGRKAGGALAVVVVAGMGLVGLWLLFSGGDDYRPEPPPPRRSPAAPAMSPSARDPSLRGAHNTFAGNPAQLRLNAVQWLAANPLVTVLCSSLAFIGAVVALIKLPAGLALILTAGIVLFLQIQGAKQKFYKGDVCPGVVLSVEHQLVAVFTDLSTGPHVPRRPAIKIFKQPLHRITTEPAFDGMRVAAAAFYGGNVRQPAWRDFAPEILHCVIRDPDEISRVMTSIPASDWEALDLYLARVPAAKAGLYRMWEPQFAPATEAPPRIVHEVPAPLSALPPTTAPARVEDGPPKPWFKTNAGIVGIAVVAVFVGIVVLFAAGNAFLRAMNRRSSANSGPVSAPPSPRPPRPSGSRLERPTATGPFTIGTRVDAHLGPNWIPGQITAINFGGHSVMVQLQDSQHRFPVVFSTNQIRLK